MASRRQKRAAIQTVKIASEPADFDDTKRRKIQRQIMATSVAQIA
jgi:hypothetical protein